MSSHRIKKKRQTEWIGHMLRRSVHVKQLIEGQVEVVEGRGRRGKQLLHDLKKTKRYCKLKKKYAPDCVVWRNGFGRDYGPITRQVTELLLLL